MCAEHYGEKAPACASRQEYRVIHREITKGGLMSENGRSGTSWNFFSTLIQVITAAVAVTALVVTVFFSWRSDQTAEKAVNIAQEAGDEAEESNRIARDALNLSRELAERAQAEKFYIGGIPPDLQGDPAINQLAVINGSSVAMHEVRVFGVVPLPDTNESLFVIPEKNSYITWSSFPACRGFTLPEEIEVTNVEFSDGSNSWTRRSDGKLEPAEPEDAPWQDEPLQPGWAAAIRDFPAPGCS